MSKIKLSIIVVFTLLFSITLFVACNSDQTEKKSEVVNIEEVLFAKYKLVKLESSTFNVEDLNTVSVLNASDKITEYTIENSAERVLLITNQSKPNTYVVIKGLSGSVSERNLSRNSGLEITKELLIEIQMDSNGNGSLNVKNITDNEEFFQTLVEGKPMELYAGNLISTRVALCQREPGENTRTCYLREVDEFCDGFIGCVALTQVSVHVLIAALCSC